MRARPRAGFHFASFEFAVPAASELETEIGEISKVSPYTPEDVKASYPKASILKGGRVVFNIKANDYRSVARIQYLAGVLAALRVDRKTT